MISFFKSAKFHIMTLGKETTSFMRVLLHTCCAPCLVIPLDDLWSEGHEVTILFYNPNIHPYSEYLRRLDAFTAYTKDKGVPALTLDQPDSMDRWFQQVVFSRVAEMSDVLQFSDGDDGAIGGIQRF